MKKAFSILVLTFSIFTSFNLFSQDTLRYNNFQSGIKPEGKFTYYESKSGYVYKIGDRLKIGVPSSNKTFAFITEGDGFLLPITPLTVSASGQETEIKKISIAGTKRSGYFAIMRSKGITGLSNYTITFENAIENGELKSFGKTSDEALAELKKAKDKLDLGLITQDDFNKKKAELIKYIK